MEKGKVREGDRVMNTDDLFPSIQRSIEQLIEDEEGTIPVKNLVSIGTIVALLTVFTSSEAFAAHGSHVSHKSHVSTAYIKTHSNHSSHGSHGSHSNHGSHSSHTSHSNTTAHSNSNYSAAGDYSSPKAPSASSISFNPPRLKTADIAETLKGINFSAETQSSEIDITDLSSPQEASGALGAVSAMGSPLDTPQP